MEKLQNVTNTLLGVLNDSCTNCVIDEEYFDCDPDHPTYLTYRARLEGTSEADSNSLVSVIEAWVRTQPNITLDEELTVDSMCSVLILSPNEELCVITTSPTDPEPEPVLSLQNIAIIAGVGGGILLICVVALVVGLRLGCKFWCRPKKPAEE